MTTKWRIPNSQEKTNYYMLNRTGFYSKLKLDASVTMQPRQMGLSVSLDEIVYKNNKTESSS